jgi:hypothetical protein
MAKRVIRAKRLVMEYWSDVGRWVEKGICAELVDEDRLRGVDSCFACTMPSATSRCHIRARSIGGSDDRDNIHLLCRFCHEESELLEGDEYWGWLKAHLMNSDPLSLNFARRGMSIRKLAALSDDQVAIVQTVKDELTASGTFSTVLFVARLWAAGIDVRLP